MHVSMAVLFCGYIPNAHWTFVHWEKLIRLNYLSAAGFVLSKVYFDKARSPFSKENLFLAILVTTAFSRYIMPIFILL